MNETLWIVLGMTFGMLFLVSGLYIFFGKQEIEADKHSRQGAANSVQAKEAVRTKKTFFKPYEDDDILLRTFKGDESDPSTYGEF